jgi:2-dehydro-3-deoxyphosphogluconate aldolase/(4S)-4-hydroxy-2-oxoglutarate aldolase
MNHDAGDPLKETLQRILETGLIPVIRVSSAGEAVDAARAVREGGLTVLEITMTVSGALDAIREVQRSFGKDVLVGAGTVLSAAAAGDALDAGARFLVSPAFSKEVIAVGRERDAVVIPGALTPTEIIAAWEAGADLVKIFPVSQVGGPAYIKALKGPLPQIPLVPTGGINLQNVGDFLRAGASAVGVGGELINKKALSEKNLASISETTRRFLDEVKKARLPK